jgi:FtsH-binding integral membrane protein
MKLPSYPGIFSEHYMVRSRSRQSAGTWLAGVFLWMVAGLLLSAGMAFLFSRDGALYSRLLLDGGFRQFVMIAPLLFALLLSFGYRQLPASIIAVLYLCFATVNGISFAVILNNFHAGSLTGCLLGCAAMFGIMAWMGYRTQTDLTRFGTMLRIGLLGLVLSLLINVFLGSPLMGYLASFAGIAIFTGLTAYDMQRLRRIGYGLEYDDIPAASGSKLAIIGAFTLYLDFINIFLMLIPGFGRRR